jgi:undecaprenyl-diphosphatase
MNLIHATLLGLVEGLTEFIPVSSTGHLILTSHALGLTQSSGAFEVVIQAGAIAAVVWHYREKFVTSLVGFLKREPSWLRFWGLILTAFFPAVVLGLSFGSWIHEHLFGPWPVIAALLIGGVAMIVVERRLPAVNAAQADLGKDFPTSYREALTIGVAQCLALWPGTSRSMATILGARLLGFSPKGAAEFSFWLAIPTLLGASAYEMFKYRDELMGSSDALLGLGVGLVVSFVSGLVVIRAFLGYLQKHSLEAFGWYRIVVAIALAIFWGL